MKKPIFTLLIMTFMLISACVPSYAHNKPDNISVNDFSGVLSDSAKIYIKSRNDILYANTQAKIIFVTTESCQGTDINTYCENLYDSWQISHIGRRNSIFVVVDTKKEEYAFLRGKNLRMALTEAQIYEILVDNFEPHFINGQYDKAIISTYNALAKWYEQHYNGLSLGLDENVDRYLDGNKVKDPEKNVSRMWMWIGLGVCLILLIIVLKIRRNIQLKIRHHERRRLRKKFKIDVDKVANS